MKRKLRKIFTCVAVLLSCYLPVVESIAATTVQWTTGSNANGHTYMATDTTTTWTDADALARSLGGYLVSINSADEQFFLNKTFLTGSYGDINYAFWTGLNDAQTEGTYIWTSGEGFTYSNWGPGEPNNYSGGTATGLGEDFVVMNWQFANGLDGAGSLGQWNDTPTKGCNLGCIADQPYRAIIEFNTDLTPSLSVSLTNTTDSVVVAGRIIYHAAISNNGGTALTGVHLTMPLPDSVFFVPESDPTTEFCKTNASNTIVDCLIGSLSVGETVTPNITLKSGLQGQISLTATVSANEISTVTANNSSSTITTVHPASNLPVADLVISFGGPRLVRLNTTPTFSLTIKNRAKFAVPGVSIKGQFPSNVKLLVNLPSYCVKNDQNLVTCGIGLLRKQTSKTFQLKAKATRRGLIATTATISSLAISDPNPANNIAPISVKVK